MKVICIENKGAKNKSIIIPVLGETYTVIEEWPSQCGLESGYILQELVGGIYPKRLFIPLSNIDETTFERNYQTATI